MNPAFDASVLTIEPDHPVGKTARILIAEIGAERPRPARS